MLVTKRDSHLEGQFSDPSLVTLTKNYSHPLIIYSIQLPLSEVERSPLKTKKPLNV